MSSEDHFSLAFLKFFPVFQISETLAEGPKETSIVYLRDWIQLHSLDVNIFNTLNKLWIWSVGCALKVLDW